MDQAIPFATPEVLEANREGRLHPQQRRDIVREARIFAAVFVGLGVADTAAVVVSGAPAAVAVPGILVLGVGPALGAAGLLRWYRRRLDDPVTMVRGPLVAERVDARTVHVTLDGHLVSTDPALAGAPAEIAVWHHRRVAATVHHEPPATT